MAEEIEVEEEQGQDDAEFDAAFADKAAQVEKAEEAASTPGEGGGESSSEDDKVFDESFTDAAGTTAAESVDAKKDEIADRLAQLEEDNKRLRQSEKSQKGRVSALTKKLVEQRAAQGPLKVEPDKVEGSDGDWEEFKREFPEMAEIVDKRLSQVDNRLNRVSEVVDQVATTQETIVQKEVGTYRAEQFETLGEKHPDFNAIKESPVFAEWRAKAPEEVQTKIRSQHAEDAIAVLDTFKAETGWGAKDQHQGKSEVELLNERRAQALKQSAGISTKKVGHSTKQDTGLADEDDFDAAFNESALKKESERSARY